MRLLNIEADAGKGLGLFEDLHGFPSADRFARALKNRAQRYYGAPFRAFIEEIVKDKTAVVQQVRDLRAEFIQLVVQEEFSGEVRRAAERFALVAAAGELATELKLTGWEAGEATRAAKVCFENWLASRRSTGSSDMSEAIRQVRGFLQRHGRSRFESIGRDGVVYGDNKIAVRDQAGFRRRKGEEWEYLIFPEVFRKEVCEGFSDRAVLKELKRRGWLVCGPPDLTLKARVPGHINPVRLYCIKASILEGDEH